MIASTISSALVGLFALLASSFRIRAALQAEILALRHQLAVLHQNSPRRLRLQVRPIAVVPVIALLVGLARSSP